MTKSNQRPAPPSGLSGRFPIPCFTTVKPFRQAAIRLSARRRFKKSWAMLAAALTILCLTSLGLRATTVADWKFDAANPTADSSGNGNTLTLNGNITFTSDVATNAPGSTNSAIFDGFSYAQTVATLNLTPYNQLTIEFFAKYTPDNGLQMFYAMNNVNNVTGAFYFDMNEAAGQLKVSQRTAVPSFVTDSAPEPTDGAWHHYALTIDESGASSVFKIYVDGYEVDAGGASGAIQPFINDYFTIGAFPPSFIFDYQGLMGEMRVSSGILAPAQFLIGAQAPVIVISQQPQNKFVLTNSPATFKVVATVQGGNPTPPLQYQWQRNGADISGATNSSYTLPAPTLNDNSAQFDVVLSALGATSVTSSNATLTVGTNATVAYWKFDAANPTADSSGNGNTLTLNGNITFSNDFPTNAPGSTNSAVFDGASYAETVGTLDLTPYNTLTIEFFAKFSPDNGLQMFYAVNNVNNVQGAFYFDMNEAAGQLKVAQRTAGVNFETDQAPEPSDGAWHHYALTMDESGASPIFKIYVDGYEVDTGGASGGIQTFINDYFTIGAFPPAYVFDYDGLMGEMRVTFGILTPAQFLIGAGLPKIFISLQPQNTGVVTNSPAMFKVVATVQNGNPPPPLQYQWQRDGVNISGATNSSYTLPTTTLSDNSAQFDVVVSAPPATPVTSSNATLTVATNAAVAYWKFDAANPTADSSGNGNDLALNGITTSSDFPTNAPGSTNSAVFDGASYAQTIGTLDLSPYNAITIEFFAKFSPGGPMQPFYDMNDPNLVEGAFYFNMNEGAPQLKVSQRTTGGYQTDVAPYPPDGAWHHYALTMNESGANPVFKIYVDGLEVDTGGQAGGIQTFNNDFFTIGAWINGSTPYGIVDYQGLMDEMRVSFGILTPEQFLSGPATLQISVASGYAVISWPGNAGNFTLQQAGNLRGAWTTVTNSPVISGLNWQVRVPTTPTGMFYRLIR